MVKGKAQANRLHRGDPLDKIQSYNLNNFIMPSIRSLQDIPLEVSDAEINAAAGLRRGKMAQEWGLTDEIVVIPSGLEIKQPGGGFGLFI